MRQLQKLLILTLGLSVVLIQSACQTMYVNSFDKIKINMSKDDVLEIAGSPNRSQRINGKDKWAYRFYTGDDKSQWDYRQVTFLEGKVVSVGVDTEELNHLKNMDADDKARDERRKAFEAAGAANSNLSNPGNPAGNSDVSATANSAAATAAQKDGTPETRVPTESDFVEVKGRRGPVPTDTEGGSEK